MKIYPTKKYNFKLIGNQEMTLERLKRRNEESKYLTSQKTSKTLKGKIYENEFKIISSRIGKGVICVLSGNINSKNGVVNVEINKAFKVIFGIIFLFPIVGIIISITLGGEKFESFMIISVIVQMLLIRFVRIWFIFQRFSQYSLNQFRDVLLTNK